MNLLRRLRVKLNRFRTRKGKLNSLMYSWKLYKSEKCDSGKEQIMTISYKNTLREDTEVENDIFDASKEYVN